MKVRVPVKRLRPIQPWRSKTVRIVDHFRAELYRELQSFRFLERPVEPDSPRDALERAVRRIWGASM